MVPEQQAIVAAGGSNERSNFECLTVSEMPKQLDIDLKLAEHLPYAMDNRPRRLAWLVDPNGP